MTKTQDTNNNQISIINHQTISFVWNLKNWLLGFVCFLVIVSWLLTFALPVFAGGLVPCGGASENPCELIDLFVMIKKIMNWMLWYGGIFATLFIAGGGIMMLISRGNPGQITKARMWITYAVIGLLLIFCAWLIINTIFVILGFPSGEFKPKWPWEIKWGQEQWGTQPTQ